ncbi:MAG: MraY family glycosyltransferase [Planctomycetaceae bacterium]
MLLFLLACVLPAFLVSLAATEFVRRRAAGWGLIDRPAARKVHRQPTPLGGGLAIWLGVVLPIAAAHLTAWLVAEGAISDAVLAAFFSRLPVHLPGVLEQAGRMWLILVGGTLLACLGLLDDRRGLPVWPRLAVQLCVAAGLVAAGVRATVFVDLPWIGGTVSVAWIVLLVNAFNFLDNMNGLTGGIGLIAASVLAAVMLTSLDEPQWLVGGALLVLAASLAGFLAHNWRGRIFMGDSGSYFVGLVMASMTIVGTFYEHDGGHGPRHVMLAPLCILAVPLYDFGSVVLIRLLQGRSPFQPDKSHFSHRLVELGLSQRGAVLTIHLATLTTGLAALLLYRVESWTGAVLIAVLVVCVLAIIAILETAGRRAGRNP